MPTLLHNENELFPQNAKLYAQVLLPLPLKQLFTYLIPPALLDLVKIGTRVIVPFGQRKIYTGIIVSISQHQNSEFELKHIVDVIDHEPMIHPIQLSFFETLASYYMCSQGEVMNAALPSGLKLSSESLLQLNPEKKDEPLPEVISDEEVKIIQSLKEKDLLPYTELPKILGKKNYLPFIKSLIQREWVISIQQVKEKYSPKIINRLFWNAPTNIQQLKPILDSLAKSPKQLDLLMDIMAAMRIEGGYHWQMVLDKKALTEKHSSSSIQSLIKKGILREEKQIVKRIKPTTQIQKPPKALNDFQSLALKEIVHQFTTKNTVLLNGVTGSGKTELYIHLINSAIENGHQVLFLVPEIALSSQLANRLSQHFADKMLLYHSKFSDNERVEVWQSVLHQECQLVLGVRSALFLPYTDLALIIVDEEHEPSYKQQSPNPRYNARDSAIMLAKLHHAKVLLGSATPSLESLHNAKTELFGSVNLNHRHADVQMPDIEIVSFADRVAPDKELPFTKTLIEQLKLNLKNGEQSLLFYNRRGYSPFIQCETCAWVPFCPSCNISLSYHQAAKKLKCHICGFTTSTPKTCKTCHSAKLLTVGTGTEKIEQDLKTLLPEARIARMDLETTRNKNGHAEIISKVENNQVDILLGTQMVAKGLDFKNVKLSCILDADKVIYYPDFRASERAYQLMTQIAGRAGRHGEKGKVYIQTSNPKNKLINWVKEQDFNSFMQHELEERRKFFYPPFSRLIQFTIYNKERESAFATANVFSQSCVKVLGRERVKGPEFPLIDKIRDYYRMITLIKLERKGIDLVKTKAFLNQTVQETLALPEHRSSFIEIDVDPNG